MILHRSIVRGVEISSDKVVPDGAIITSPEAASALEDLTTDLAEFKESVVRSNIDMVEGYKNLQEEFGGEVVLLSAFHESGQKNSWL